MDNAGVCKNSGGFDGVFDGAIEYYHLVRDIGRGQPVQVSTLLDLEYQGQSPPKPRQFFFSFLPLAARSCRTTTEEISTQVDTFRRPFPPDLLLPAIPFLLSRLLICRTITSTGGARWSGSEVMLARTCMIRDS
jgi:hypothetical protein